MANIPDPKPPRVTGDTVGPNWPGTVNPGFDNPYRDKGGDTVGAGDYAGRKKSDTPSPWAMAWPWR